MNQSQVELEYKFEARRVLVRLKESAAINFVRDAFGHLKAIAADKGGQALLGIANLGRDAGVVRMCLPLDPDSAALSDEGVAVG